MKIATNFVPPAQRAVQPTLILGWIATAALVVLAAALVRDARDLGEELPALRERVARSASATRIDPAPLPTGERELTHTRERVSHLNQLARTVGTQSAEVLAELETLLPPQAWLTRWHYRATEGELTLVAAAPSAEPLSLFLLQLERSALFEQAMLLREVQRTGAPDSPVQFEIRLKVRS